MGVFGHLVQGQAHGATYTDATGALINVVHANEALRDCVVPGGPRQRAQFGDYFQSILHALLSASGLDVGAHVGAPANLSRASRALRRVLRLVDAGGQLGDVRGGMHTARAVAHYCREMYESNLVVRRKHCGRARAPASPPFTCPPTSRRLFRPRARARTSHPQGHANFKQLIARLLAHLASYIAHMAPGARAGLGLLGFDEDDVAKSSKSCALAIVKALVRNPGPQQPAAPAWLAHADAVALLHRVRSMLLLRADEFISFVWVRKHPANVLTAYHIMRCERQRWRDETAAAYAARGRPPPAWLHQGDIVGVVEMADDDDDGVGDGVGDGDGDGDGGNASDSDDDDDDGGDDGGGVVDVAGARRAWRAARALERVMNPRVFSLVPMAGFHQ